MLGVNTAAAATRSQWMTIGPPPLNFIVPGVGLPRHTESVLILRLQMPVWVHDAHLLRPH